MVNIVQADNSRYSNEQIIHAYEILIAAYAETEDKIWGKNYIRIPFTEFQGLIAKGEIYFALIQDEIVGSIHIYKLHPSVLTFSLLNANPIYKGLGIGKALISEVEKIAKQTNAKKIVLEILQPENFTIPFKETLAAWYVRNGFNFKTFSTFLSLKPSAQEKAKNLITPAHFACYEKLIN